MITLRNQHDPDLQITLGPPAGSKFEDAFAEFFDASAAGREYFARSELVRACAVEPSGEKLADLLKAWSGLPMVAWAYCADLAGQGMIDALTLIDPRSLLDGSETSAVHLAALEKQGVSAASIEQWLRAYPRKGPPGEAQFVIARFAWGYYGCRAPEPQEWFDVETQRARGQHYEVSRRFVKSCTLFPSVPDIMARNKTTPALVTILCGLIRTAAGEGLAQRVGESSGA
jgi:hypothetical protein